MASVPISAITPLLVAQLSRRPLPEPVTMAQATAVGAAAGAGIVLSSRAQVGAGIVLSTAVPDHSVAAAGVGAAAGEPPVGAAAGVGVGGSGDRRAYPNLSGTPRNAKGCQFC